MIFLTPILSADQSNVVSGDSTQCSMRKIVDSGVGAEGQRIKSSEEEMYVSSE